MAGSGGAIDFARLNDALLARAEYFVPLWLPGGDIVGHEYVCADLSGGHGKSCSVNLRSGMWADFAGDDRGGDLVSLYAAVRGLNNGQAARELMVDLGFVAAAEDAVTPNRRAPGAPQASARGAEPPSLPPSLPPEAYAGHAATTVKPERRKSMWRALRPVPPHAPAPTFKHFERLEADRVGTWEYRFDGQLLGYVVRFRTSDGGKDTLPYTWCIDESDDQQTCRWHWKTWDEPRPLYVPATLLSGAEGADQLPVVLVEGEKCAEAGHKLLGHEFDFVSWPGGGKAWAKADWSWLAGRVVFMWPDCDAKRFPLTPGERLANVDPATKALKPEARQPGVEAMAGIGTVLLQHQRCRVYLCKLPKPGDVKDGWDIADAIEQGWDAEQVRGFIRAAVPFRAPDGAVRANSASTPTRADAGEVGNADPGAEEPSSRAWRAHLLTSASTGSVTAVRENLVLALDGWPARKVPGVPECAGLIRFNEFSNNVEKVRTTPWGSPPGDWAEADELLMGDWLCREHGLPSMARQALEEAVVVVSRRHAYHPLRARIEALRGQWDGVPRLDSWLRRVCLEEDEYDARDPLQQYLTLVGRWFLMGMCARVMSPQHVKGRQAAGPGVKFDYMLVLEGKTGWGKSTLAALLGGEYFADTGLDVQHKDSLMNIQGVHVYEWSELDQLAKQDIGAVKRFISSAFDRFRATFDRRPAKYPRQVVFVGTTEEAHYLLDNKGNRRFWPVRLTRPPDLDWLRENLEQMLAEAVVLVDSHAPFWPDRDQQRRLFDPQQLARTMEGSLDAAIRRYLYQGRPKNPHGEPGNELTRVTMIDLLTVIGYPIDKQTDAVVKRAGSMLNALGWTQARPAAGEDGKRPRVYVRPKGEPAASATADAAAGDDGDSPPGSDCGEGQENSCPF